jgi:hypothetical protein
MLAPRYHYLLRSFIDSGNALIVCCRLIANLEPEA